MSALPEVTKLVSGKGEIITPSLTFRGSKAPPIPLELHLGQSSNLPSTYQPCNQTLYP